MAVSQRWFGVNNMKVMESYVKDLRDFRAYFHEVYFRFNPHTFVVG